MSESNNTQNGGEGAAEHALREGLRSPTLSAGAMQRIRAAAQQEWRTAHPAEPVRAPARRWLSLAAAASVAMLAGVLGWNAFMGNTAGSGAAVGQLAIVVAVRSACASASSVASLIGATTRTMAVSLRPRRTASATR